MKSKFKQFGILLFGCHKINIRIQSENSYFKINYCAIYFDNLLKAIVYKCVNQLSTNFQKFYFDLCILICIFNCKFDLSIVFMKHEIKIEKFIKNIKLCKLVWLV